MEDDLLRNFPMRIKKAEGFIAGLEADMKTLEAHPHPIIVEEKPAKADGEPSIDGEPLAEPAAEGAANGAATITKGFAGMEIHGVTFTDKAEAGKMLLAEMRETAKKREELKLLDPVKIGSYRGFSTSLSVEGFGSKFILTLNGEMTHRAELGEDVIGNFLRIDHALDKMPERISSLRGQIANLHQQVEALRGEVGKPFPQEGELQKKSARLAELNAELGIDDGTAGTPPAPERPLAKADRPSVLNNLKRPLPPRQTGNGGKNKNPKQER